MYICCMQTNKGADIVLDPRAADHSSDEFYVFHAAVSIWTRNGKDMEGRR